MADEVQVIEQPQQNNDAAWLDQQMKLALGGNEKNWKDVPQPQAATTIENPNPTADQSQVANPTATTDPQPTVAENPFEIIKNTFNYQSVEDVIKDIEDFRALKNNPTPAQIKYENEQSEKLHKAIQSGDRKQVLKILSEQDQIDRLVATDVTKETAAEIVKTGMALKYKDLDNDEINFKFNKQYGLPPKPTMEAVKSDTNIAEADEENEYNRRIEQWQSIVSDKTMELMIDAKLAKPDIESAKTKLELPNIDNPVSEDYLLWQKEMEEVNKLDAQAAADYAKFTPDAIKLALEFNDEANKIKFPYQYKADDDSFKEAIELVSDYDKFWNMFLNSDGSPNRPKFLEFVYKGLFADKMIMEGIKQGSNARFKAQLPDNSNGTVRYLPQDQQQLNELDKQMEKAGIKRAAV